MKKQTHDADSLAGSFQSLKSHLIKSLNIDTLDLDTLDRGVSSDRPYMEPEIRMTPPDESKLRLMVVDDEADNLDLLYRTFRRQFEVYKAESAFAALQLLEAKGEMGIIISDQRMPGMNGTEFLSRAAERFPDTIRILLTGYTDVEDLVEAINAGKVFKYITKPWSPEDLHAVVQQAAETYRVLKQRTNELHRALRRESIFNAVTRAIRESLDYHSMLQTIAETLSHTFQSDACLLQPLETTSVSPQATACLAARYASPSFSYITPTWEEGAALIAALQQPVDTPFVWEGVSPRSLQISPACELPYAHLTIPLVYQQEALAVLSLFRRAGEPLWSAEDQQIIAEVAEQSALALSQARLYQRIQQQTEQMRAELAVARQIQTNLLRQELPVLDTVKIQACCIPAREVGGDFFEVYVHPQGDIWVAVGDVSGKGVPAALFMASAISVLRRELSQENPPEPDQMMRNLNSSLSNDLVSSNCFITMVLARYSPQTQELVYANAGHIYPLIWSKVPVSVPPDAPSPEPRCLKVRGVPLGILPLWKAPAGRLQLQAGEVLLLTSDGITEATVAVDSTTGKDSTMLQQSGLWQLLHRQQGAFDLSKILSYVQAYSNTQDDDQTLLALEVL